MDLWILGGFLLGAGLLVLWLAWRAAGNLAAPAGDGRAEIVAGAGPGGAPQVKVFHGATNAEISSFLAYPTAVTSGVFVGVPWRPLTVPPAAPATAAAEVPGK